MILTAEQKLIGTQNFSNFLGTLRRDFLQQSLSAEHIGPFYFGYGKPPGEPVRAGIVGTGNEGCEAMIRQSSPAYLKYVAYHDIRPSQERRARQQFIKTYGKAEGDKVKFYDKWQEMLDDKSIEAIVIATPLWTHASFAIEAMKAKKHVLCEKLMARTITDAKEMVKVADAEKRVLAIGHQRHYSTLYANVLEVVNSGVLGEIKHIRALWHRNNTWEYKLRDLNMENEFARSFSTDATVPRRKVNGEEYILNDGWYPPTPADDMGVDYKKYGYDSVEQLIRWRLYNRTGGGLMAELGSHQLDACSLFLHKVHPKAVLAYGGHQYYQQKYGDKREAADHVYCTFEMPGDVTLLYTSINTNSLPGYGEIIYGTHGVLVVMNEREVFLFRESEPGDPKATLDRWFTAAKSSEGKLTLAWTGSGALTPDGILAEAAIAKASWFVPAGESAPFSNRGYHEEIEAFADAIRNPGRKVRCDGRVALADTVMALTANIAMVERKNERVGFQPDWYDPNSSAVPDGRNPAAVAGK